MKIAKHWFKGTAKATLPDGQIWDVRKWGWSDVSEADARAMAEAAAQDLAKRVEAAGGWPDPSIAKRIRQGAETGEWADAYSYGQRGQPLREEIITEHRDATGRPLIAITRNSYGALVLNTAEAMFIDIDGEKEKPAPSSGGGFFASLFGKKTPPAPAPAAPRESPELQRVRTWAQSHPDWSLRVYETKAGLRVLVTHTLITPESDIAQNTMRELQADPLYVHLCRAQQCFRARLTPKPWRIDIKITPQPFPCSGRSAERMARWKADYDGKSAAFATCKLVAEFGPRQIHPAIAAVVQLHDTATKATAALPLA